MKFAGVAKLFQHILAVCLLIGIMTPVFSAPPEPTAEQLQRLRDLDPEQRAALGRAMEREKKAGAKKQQTAAEQPVLVTPLPVSDGREAEQPVQDVDDSSVARKEPELPRFGYDLFSGTPTTFAPATDIPISADYVIGPGDTVEIQLYGKQNVEYSLVVTREGHLQFPEIGPVAVAGLTFEEMKAALKARVDEQMIGEKVTISMGELRSIRVFVLGDANRPGSYTVSALSTMTNALFVSGGVNAIGSLRDIQLKRRGELVTRLDLYDLLLRGDTSGDVRLQPGDVIFIPPAGSTVGVSGEVRRPAIYELRKESAVEQVLALAGGLLPTAYPQATQIERINARGERTLVDLDISKTAGRQARLQSGDLLRVHSILEKMENIVLLTGHVQRPGGYEWRPGMRIADLVPSIADDLLPRPDLEYALVKRELKPDHRLELFSVRLGEAIKNPASALNVALEPRDELIVFGFSEDREPIVAPLVEDLKAHATFQHPAPVVAVSGLVRQPGGYPLEQGMRVSDLVRAGGGLAEAAYALGAELTRYAVIDGSYREVDHVEVNLAQILEGSAPADLVLQAHDTLQIKRLPEWAAADTVEIRGEVKFPGVYPIARGEQLSRVLERAGGITDMAFPQGAVFVRAELRERERERLDELSRRLEMDLASLALKLAQEDATQTQALDLTRGLAEKLRAVEPTGRLVIDLPKLLATTRGGRRSEYDINLVDGDKLYIPPVTQEVTVTGEVFYPTSHLYKKGLDSENYVKMSGGATAKADTRRIYVVRADGSVLPRGEIDASWFGGAESQAIRPGDTIVVPLDVERVRPINLWTNVSQIIYQLAIAAASANAIGVF
ncbi:MAG: SLBB domain-containing protein [Thiogranum sp.]|nr:SLBB domain-containing protein [Thiogranum sp.]